MHIFRSLAEIPASWGPAVVSVGNFDGVHLAHREVLGRMQQRARHLGLRALAITFQPHPMRVLRPDVPLRLITPTDVKLRLLDHTGLEAVLVLPFTRDLSLMTPEDFARQVLCEGVRAREVHEGFNFHFGHHAQGDVKTLEHLGRAFGFEVVAYGGQRCRGNVISSSRIRELLLAGHVARANRLLGRSFSIVARAGRGRGYGHRYTVPTMNLSHYDELLPRDGVYVTCTRLGRERFQSVTNIGTRPTFGAESFAIESHLLNFHEVDLTSETEIEVSFLHRLRDEIKFPSVEALRAQIGRDVARARRYFHLAKLFLAP